MGYVVADKLTGVVALPKAQVSLVLCHVVNAVRDDLPFCVALKVVVVDLAWLLGVGRTAAVKVAQHFFLFGVDAQHRKPIPDERLLEFVDSPELLITPFHLRQAVGFNHFPLLVPVLPQQLHDDFAARIEAFGF